MFSQSLSLRLRFSKYHCSMTFHPILLQSLVRCVLSAASWCRCHLSLYLYLYSHLYSYSYLCMCSYLRGVSSLQLLVGGGTGPVAWSFVRLVARRHHEVRPEIGKSVNTFYTFWLYNCVINGAAKNVYIQNPIFLGSPRAA